MPCNEPYEDNDRRPKENEMARRAPKNPETTPPDRPPRKPVDPITRGDPTAVPDPKPIDDPSPAEPSGATLRPLDLEIERLIKIVETRLH
jgi:hypothetical protein